MGKTMPSSTRSTVKRTFSISSKASEAIDRYADRNNETKSKTVENAVLALVNDDHDAQLERKIDEIHDCVVGEGGTVAAGDTHTHSDAHTDDGRDDDLETDGGSSVVGGSSTFNSISSYSPNYPSDRQLSREALRQVPSAAEDLEIDPEHVDYSILRSRGMNVSVKAAVCAAIIRHEHTGTLSEDDIMDLASDVLGSTRNARRQFDEIASNFVSDPNTHDDITPEKLTELPNDIKQKLACKVGYYAPSLSYVGRVYYTHMYSERTTFISSKIEGSPTRKEVVACHNQLIYLWEKRDMIEKHVPDIEDFGQIYHNTLLESVLEMGNENDIEIGLPTDHGEVKSVDELEEISA